MPKKEGIKILFDDISPEYDRLNHILSMNIDKRWRKKAVRRIINTDSPLKVLDVACGTGDFSIAIASRALKIKSRGVKVTGIDISEGMMRVGRKKIKKAGFKAGVAINPETPLSMIEAYMHKLDKITFMSVDPGFAGQAFIPEVLDKVREARRLKDENPEKYHFIIEIDGSCNARTFKLLADAGIESFIVGTSGLFNNDPDLEKAWDILMDNFNRAVNA